MKRLPGALSLQLVVPLSCHCSAPAAAVARLTTRMLRSVSPCPKPISPSPIAQAPIADGQIELAPAGVLAPNPCRCRASSPARPVTCSSINSQAPAARHFAAA